MRRIGGNGVMQVGYSGGRTVRTNYVLKASIARSHADLQRYAMNPNVRALLDFIAAAEGVKSGYQTTFGNNRITDFSRHPGERVRQGFTRTDGTKSSSDASGRYQFMGYTWNRLQKLWGFSDFTPGTQDKAAVALILEKKGAMEAILNGDYITAIKKIGGTWASLPSAPSEYRQHKRSWDFVHSFFKNRGF